MFNLLYFFFKSNKFDVSVSILTFLHNSHRTEAKVDFIRLGLQSQARVIIFYSLIVNMGHSHTLHVMVREKMCIL